MTQIFRITREISGFTRWKFNEI